MRESRKTEEKGNDGKTGIIKKAGEERKGETGKVKIEIWGRRNNVRNYNTDGQRGQTIEMMEMKR